MPTPTGMCSTKPSKAVLWPIPCQHLQTNRRLHRRPTRIKDLKFQGRPTKGVVEQPPRCGQSPTRVRGNPRKGGRAKVSRSANHKAMTNSNRALAMEIHGLTTPTTTTTEQTTVKIGKGSEEGKIPRTHTPYGASSIPKGWESNVMEHDEDHCPW